MGESSMDVPIADNTMEDSGPTGVTALQVSVSFGRFENDLLAWEKWSTFPTNKYLEEVEKCSTPGSVAQKKAYFEAHYKKIAARKAEQEDQDKKRGAETRDPMDLENHIQRGLAGDFGAVEQELNVEKIHDQNPVSGIELEDEVANSTSEISGTQADETKGSFDMVSENEDSLPLIDAVKDESSCKLVIPELHKSEKAALVPSLESQIVEELPQHLNDAGDKVPSLESQRVEELPRHMDNVGDKVPSLESQRVEELPQHMDNAGDEVSVDKEEKVKSEKSLKSQKATTVKKATNTTIPKKKPTASLPKSSLLSTPKLSRPALSKSTMSESRGLSKKDYNTSPLINKKPTRAESRKAVPSLHMSLSLGPANSEPAPSTTMRKSLIMEKMGDKDIVKRAFKAFRNNFNQISSSSPGKPTLTSQIPGKVTGTKASVVGTPQKKIEGVNEPVKKSSQSSQPGLRKTSNAPRFPKAVGADQNGKSVSSPYGLRSHDKPDKRKKKVEEKVNGKATERSQLLSKVKNEPEIKRLPHNHNAKAKPISGTVTPKGFLDKKVGKD